MSDKERDVKILKSHIIYQEPLAAIADEEGASQAAISALMLNTAVGHAAQHYNWLMSALTALAKRKLKDANDTRENENDWPAGQEWDDLAGSSQSIFFRQAMEEAGIPREEILSNDRIILYSNE